MNNEPQNSDDVLSICRRSREDAMAMNPLIDSCTSETIERCKDMAYALGRLINSPDANDAFMTNQLSRIAGVINCALAFEQRRLDGEVVTERLR